MSKFFIDRPVFAWVIAIGLMLAGALAIVNLPINQFPDVAPPAISVQVVYPGATAQTVRDTTVQIIEQQLNGLDGLRYISSDSNADGTATIIATFEQGTNPDVAQVQVQNKLQVATPMLPQEVQRQGLRVAKYKQNFMLVVGVVSEDGRMTGGDLGDYVASTMQDPIARTPGVGDFVLFGSQYAMRIWLDPERLNGFQLTPPDVIGAIQAQNIQVASGQVGGLPARDGVQLSASVIGKVRMRTAEEFERILLKVNADGSQVRLRDVATIGLGSESFSISTKFNDGLPSAGMALRLATGANQLETTAAVRRTIAELEPTLPPGVKVVFPYDTSPVVLASIEAVVHTLVEAMVLVFLVMFLFLQNWRATLIPTLAVPVVLLATFGVLFAFGFTINVMTMFAMVLAIGLLVDDAIIVVENVERIMAEEGLSAKEAARKSMDQLSGALVGVALVLSAVFMPMSFFGGSTGVIYRQFAITIISAMAFSVLVAMIFTPALCATLLKPHSDAAHERRGFFGWFNRMFDRGTRVYQRGVRHVLLRRGRFMAAYVAIVAAVAVLFNVLPTAFLPNEDQGVLLVQVQTPPNASAERTRAVLDRVAAYLLEEESETVASVFAVNGFNYAGRGQSSGAVFVLLKPFEQRSAAGRDVFSLAARAQGAFAQIKDATVLAIVPPSLLELGNSMGFDLYIQDKAGLGQKALQQARDRFLGLASGDPVLALVRPNSLPDEAQYRVEIDDERARALGVSIDDINQTMSAAWGSTYVNDFIDRNRVKRVYVQGRPDSRLAPEDFDQWYVRNGRGDMVSFASFATGSWVHGSPKLQGYGGLPAVQIQGQPAPGYSTGDAMAAIARIAAQLPAGIGVEYTGLSYEERQAGSQTLLLYTLSLIVVFLCLAALYESWSVPLSVLLVVPLGVLGALVATLTRGLANDVFFQVGLLTTMGLAAKNAILIVEFAKELHEKHGRSLVDAALEAARQRLRPIVMTSLAFVFGVLPLAFANGASGASQQSIGTGVVGGTIAATLLAICFVPLFYVIVSSLFKWTRRAPAHELAARGELA